MIKTAVYPPTHQREEQKHCSTFLLPLIDETGRERSDGCGIQKRGNPSLTSPPLPRRDATKARLRRLGSTSRPYNSQHKNKKASSATATSLALWLSMLVASVKVGDVRLHHVLHQLLESDFRHPAKLLLRLGTVALEKYIYMRGGQNAGRNYCQWPRRQTLTNSLQSLYL